MKQAKQAIANAQALGIAERDYRTDIEGYDVAEKTVIHANAFWGTAFTLHDADRQGISEISRGMLEEMDLLSIAEAGKNATVTDLLCHNAF